MASPPKARTPRSYFYVWLDAPVGYMASHQNWLQKSGRPDSGFSAAWGPDSVEDVRGVALATTGVLTITAGLSYLVERWVLVPYELPYLRIMAFLALTLLTVKLVNLVLRQSGQHLPLITTNCAVLGVALLTAGTSDSVAGAIALGFGAGLGFSLVLLLFAGLGPRLEQTPVPAALRGPAITLITLGMVSLAVLGFSGFGT